MDIATIWTITQKELRDAIRNRWFILFTIAFALLAVGLSALSRANDDQLQFAGFDRTAASLINLVILFVPLIGLSLGAVKIATEQESGVLSYLLSQPITYIEIFIGKYLGLASALFTSIMVGFGIAGLLLATQGNVSNAGGYLMLILLSCLLALAMVSIGFLLAVIFRSAVTAVGGSLFTWLFFVFIGDLGVMGTALLTNMSLGTVFLLAILNPLQAFKMLAIINIQANLDVLGPVGIYAVDQYGAALPIILLLSLLVWIIVPFIIAIYLFSPKRNLILKGS